MEQFKCLCGCSETPKKGNKFVHGHNRKLSTKAYVVDPITDCWNWQRCTNIGGYAEIRKNNKNYRVHILHYEDKYGKVPQGLELDHICRNRSCVNPDHVEPVTSAENTQRGASTKLTYEQVLYIRAMAKNKTPKELAMELDVSITHIKRIQEKKSWRNM